MNSTAKSKILLVFFFLISSNTFVSGQINTPAGATRPFPQNVTYPYGLKASTSALSSADVITAYNSWKSTFYQSCGGSPLECRILFDDLSSTVSEGIGYGMLIAAYMGDQPLFNCLWTYYKNRRNANGLMNWKYGSCNGVSGSNGATDADEDAGMALLIADCQWGSAGTINYKSDATNLITAMKVHEVEAGTNNPKPGDMFGGASCMNPSYFAPAYYHAFAQVYPADATLWNNVATQAYKVLNANANSTTGLVSDWTTSSGSTATSCTNGPNYGYDAARTPSRISMDYLWFGTAASKTWETKVTTWVNGQGISTIGDGYNTSGGKLSNNHNSTFTGAFAVGAMSGGTQAQVDAFATDLKNIPAANDAAYFQRTLRVIYMLQLTGNFWWPCTTSPPCRQPALGLDFSTCGSSFPYTLNSNTPTASGVTFTWKRIIPSASTLVTSSSTQNTFSVTSAMGAGTYAVIRDSTGGCTASDTLVISSTLLNPVISPAGPINLCNPASVNFTVTNAASFPAGTTWQWYNGTGTTIITGANTSSLSNVRTAATYKVIASISGCTSTFDQEVVTSNLPTPVDGCASSGNIPLSITNAGTGPYQWYSASSGGSSLGTGTSFSAPSPGTYYVQDMSAASGSVGPTVDLGTGTNWGVNTGNRLLFTATQNFTLNGFKIPFNIYGGGSGTVTIQIWDNTNAVKATYTTNAVTTSGSGTQMIAFTFSPGVLIDQATWGSNLKMVVSAETINGDLLWNNVTTAAYSYNSSPAGIVTITGEEGGDAVDTKEYMYFYDWQITTGTPCARLPVIASNSGCTTSPVSLINFYANDQSNKVELHWTTASEKNNHFFKVERSSDGFTFLPIGTVKGAGNSSTILYYSFTDLNPVFGTSYYRLAQYDFDETREYSPVISLSRSDKTAIDILPNPFNHSTNILIRNDLNEKIQVKIMDLTGQVVYSSDEHYTNQNIMVGENFSAGMYIVQVMINGRLYYTKIVKG